MRLTTWAPRHSTGRRAAGTSSGRISAMSEDRARPDVIRTLLELGANPNIQDRRPKGFGRSSGWTPLFVALASRTVQLGARHARARRRSEPAQRSRPVRDDGGGRRQARRRNWSRCSSRRDSIRSGRAAAPTKKNKTPARRHRPCESRNRSECCQPRAIVVAVFFGKISLKPLRNLSMSSRCRSTRAGG